MALSFTQPVRTTLAVPAFLLFSALLLTLWIVTTVRYYHHHHHHHLTSFNASVVCSSTGAKNNNNIFQPIALQNLGALITPAMKFLNALGCRISSVSAEDRSGLSVSAHL